MRLVFMGTPDFAVPSLKVLREAGHDICGVVTQPDRPRGRGQNTRPTPVKENALEAGLPVSQSRSNEELLRILKQWRPERIIVVAYGRILPQSILELPPGGCINVHASLLPRYRGAAPIHRAVLNGEMETGITTMWMTTRMDAGDIILQEKLPIPHEATTGDIHDRLAVLGSAVLKRTLDLLEAGTAPRIIQDETLATYAPPLTPEEEVINWHRTAAAIYNHIRGFNPWPGAYTMRSGKRLKIFRARIMNGEKDLIPVGQVAAVTDEGFVVQTGKGQLLVTEVQPQGKKVMTAPAYLCGYPMTVGECLG